MADATRQIFVVSDLVTISLQWAWSAMGADPLNSYASGYSAVIQYYYCTGSGEMATQSQRYVLRFETMALMVLYAATPSHFHNYKMRSHPVSEVPFPLIHDSVIVL